ncbi:MAG: tRNA glutamyl-Q(34) synthetase GluQRS [Desulfovibrionaceae bacterium]|jgi:glutamyl-Q tRNA(Asp) synthetase|nr:tRNA glutamyl-Q(34) synthetase GluQRS [Desulfovibrionaceae bacterium]
MYVGRFAPSPTGPLHAGSLVAALASWLDARAHDGQWLVRIEDIDAPRCVPGADQFILRQLQACHLLPDAAPVWQSRRGALYRQALDRLQASGWAYPCGCSRKDIEAAQTARGSRRARGAELPYPGTCRPENGGLHGRPPRAWRLRTGASNADEASVVSWIDRRLGRQQQDVERAVGDFVLLRADGLWAYQLAVVVDDASQGVTHVVRGEDLADNTPRQILLQRALGLPAPAYLHAPLALAADGHKLSKQNGARALDLSDPLTALQAAAARLDLPPPGRPSGIGESLAHWTAVWRDRWGR